MEILEEISVWLWDGTFRLIGISETSITKGVIIFLLAIVIKTFILCLISGRTNGSILSPIMLAHKFNLWHLERGRGIDPALTWWKECHLLSACPSFANVSMQSIVFNPNSDSVQSSLLMIWVDVVTAQDVSVQAKET